MASRSRTTFKKRQKELARIQKQRDKAARRLERKAEKQAGITHPEEDLNLDLEHTAQAPLADELM